MKTTAYKILLITFFAFGCWFAGYSQQYPDSLLRYLEIASKNNPVVLQKFSEYQAALQKVPQVGSLSDPELTIGVFLKPMELISGNQVADIRLMQMFPWFGVLKNAKDEMSLMANGKYELFRDSKLQVYYEVQRTWYELFKIRNEISISEKNIEILKIIERLALIRFKSPTSGATVTTPANKAMPEGSSQLNSSGSSGMQVMGTGQINSGSLPTNQAAAPMQNASMGSSSGTPGLVDLYKIQIETGDLENSIALLKNQEQTTVARFNSYLNRPPVSPVFVNDTLIADSLGISQKTISGNILEKNPMLSMLEFEKQSIEARKKMVIAMGYPMVGIGVNYTIINKTNSGMASPEMIGKDMVMPMVTLTLPVYRKKYNAMAKETELMKNATSENYQATANSLQTEYYQALQLYKDAQRRIKLYKNQYQLASKSLDLTLKSFSTSSSELTDVLRVRQQTLDYELKQVEAVADFNTSIAWLKRLMAF